MQPYFILTRYSHFFSLTNVQVGAVGMILNFSVRYVQRTFARENGKTVLKPSRVFGARISDEEFRFHIGQYDDFIRFMANQGIDPHLYSTVDVPLYTPASFKSVVHPRYEAREYQTNIINFLVNEEIGDNHSRLVGLQTGAGKTMCSLAAASKIGHKIVIIVLSKYIEKWAGDVCAILDVKPKEVLIIQGGKDLRSLLNLSIDQEVDAKVIIISLTTIQGMYDDYKQYGRDIVDHGYPYKPEEMFKYLKAGILIFDEAHQHLYGVFRVLLHTHIPKVIALTATLISDEPFIDKMQNIMFPKEIRYNKVPINKYVKVRVFSYGVYKQETMNRIRTTARGSTTYSHIEFEKSIMKHAGLLNNYLDIVTKLVKINYIEGKLDGDKCIVFASSIAMCNHILARLKKELPKLDIRRYVENDPYENVIDADIRVTTIISAGTAIDIPNLRVAIMTNSVQSPVANLQTLGRLRQLKDRDVVFCYLYNYRIKKQSDYHMKKKELFADRAVSIKEYRLDEGI